MKKFKVYLIDFDGTLINSFNGLVVFYNAIFNAVGVEITKEDCYLFTKMSLQEAYQRKVKDDSKDKMKLFLNKCDEMVDSGVLLKHNIPYLDTIPFINYIKDNNIVSGIVTGNTMVHCKMVFDYNGIDHFYKTYVDSKELTYQKPHPEGILKALEKLHYQGDKKDVCYVGDALNDFYAARDAGVTPVLLDRNNEYKESEEYILIHSLVDLIK